MIKEKPCSGGIFMTENRIRKILGWLDILLLNLLPAASVPLLQQIDACAQETGRSLPCLLITTIFLPIVFGLLLVFGAVFFHQTFSAKKSRPAAAWIGLTLSVLILIVPWFCGSCFFFGNTSCIYQSIVIAGWLAALLSCPCRTAPTIDPVDPFSASPRIEPPIFKP
jgi:hypothetical protein